MYGELANELILLSAVLDNDDCSEQDGAGNTGSESMSREVQLAKT